MRIQSRPVINEIERLNQTNGKMTNGELWRDMIRYEMV